MLIVLFLLLGMTIKSQVIYERTYPDAAIYIEKLFELSDNSTVSFSIAGRCPFAEWLQIDANGNPMALGSLGDESAHSLDARWIGTDSILTWYRIGPLDFDGYNSFNVKLWTPTEITTLVEDTVSYYFWEDLDVNYGAFLFQNNKLIYQKEDTLYEKDILTGQIEHEVIQPYLFSPDIFPILDHLLVFPSSGFTTLYDQNLQPVFSWSNSLWPGEYAVSIDSFLVSVTTPGYPSLHIINAFDETFRDLDLSAYFTEISSLSVNKNVLMVRGNSGSQPIVLQLDTHFNILTQKNLDIPQPNGINEMAFTYFPERVYAISYDNVASYKANYRVCYHYPDANPIQYIDVALDSAWVDSIHYWPPDQHLPAAVFVKCKVSNQSADTIESVTIHFVEPPLGTCDPGVYPRHYEGLNILPGETEMIVYQTYSWELPFGDPFIRTFYVEHANHHLDADISNNVFTVSYLTSGTEDPGSTTEIVYPNPFTDLLTTSFRDQSVQMILYDQMNKIVSQGQDQLNDLSKLPVGIYFLQIQIGHQFLTRKVVKL